SFPAISLRPFTTSRRVATLFTFATLAENSSASPTGGAKLAGVAAATVGCFGTVGAVSTVGCRATLGTAGLLAAGGSGVKFTEVLLCPPACNHTKAAAPHVTARKIANTTTARRLIPHPFRSPKFLLAHFRRTISCRARTELKTCSTNRWLSGL